MFFGNLSKAILWDSLTENVPIALWPYSQEVLMFGNRLDNWCTSREAIEEIYEDTIPKLIKDGGAVVMESISANEKADEWNKDALSQVLNTCGDTSVFFTNASRVEDPGWIVTSREGEGWSMKLIRSLDQEQRPEIYSVDDIYAKVLPEYPDIGYVDPNTTLNL
ncbi:hypothetical protein QFC21_007083 [Naganishia friedmannii]|uniref:Uncharacterized protein n=1 Tax=Naganishia friedmannii TaxID=89922 RepID=A0ACC2UXG8_9TREE|nr:hypothetical protein QFC21_007083 [Naganishia friedmannii]